MKIALHDTWSSLAQSLALGRDPLGIFSIINLYAPSSWSFEFTFDSQNRVIIEIKPSSELDARVCLSGMIPEIFGSDLVTFKHLRRCYMFSPSQIIQALPDDNRLETNDAISDAPWMRIVGYGGAQLSPILSDLSKVRSYLLNNTWLGAFRFSEGLYSIRVKIFDCEEVIANRSPIRDALQSKKPDDGPVFSRSMPVGNPPYGSINFVTFCGVKDAQIRWDTSGYLKPDVVDKLFGKSANTISPPGFLEISYGKHVPDRSGLIEITEETRRDLGEFCAAIESMRKLPEFVSFVKSSKEYEKVREAKRIDERKNRVAKSEFIFVNDILVYKRPESEMETIALHQKLEGMGCLPFNQFVSLEYTAKLGIDSIAHFKVKPTEALHKFATVEFEYVFKNFLSHQHPIEQTDIIICWLVGDSQKYDLQSVSGMPWLYRFVMDGHQILVAEISKYPGIELKKLTGA